MSQPEQSESATESAVAANGSIRLIRGVMGLLASPALTAMLIVLSIILVLLGTLAQVYMDIWLVVHDYFRAWLAWVEVKVLFPPAFFPWASHHGWDELSVQRFPFPGGASLGLALVINLVAAQVIRFKMQARGLRLLAGLVVLAVGVVVTWLVIQAGHNPQGVQGEPLLAWSTLWLLLQLALAALFVLSLAGLLYVLFRLKRKRTAELVGLSLSTVATGSVLAWVLLKGDAAILTDSSLRILYNLIQGELAALSLLAACALLFGRRAGIVLLHGGVGLMMFGEFFVSFYAEEQQMTIVEGQSVNYTRDIRSAELAIKSFAHEGRENVVVVPMKRAGKTTPYADGDVASPDELPFALEVVRYDSNSTMRSIRPGEQSPATGGLGLRFVAEPAEAEASAGSNRIDLASAYVKATDKQSGEVLGTYLVSQHFTSFHTLSNALNVGATAYGLELRFKRSYKPYSVTLLDVRKDDYVGTRMPRNYSSQVKLDDPSRDVQFETKIWMNNPLRYAGETFYQSGYNPGSRGRESTTLQVVKNTGWMIPYVSCMIAATGMLMHFVVMLLRFLRRSQQGGEPSDPGKPDADPVSRRPALPLAIRVLVPLATVMLGAIYIGNKAIVPETDPQRMDLDQFGDLPVMYQGRVKPIDTLARNSLRILSNRQTVVDSHGNSQPATRWLLDVISRPEAAEAYKVFRIDNPDLLKSLGLEKRRGFRYSWTELGAKAMEFQRQLAAAQRQPPQQRTLQQRKLVELRQRMDRYQLLVDAFRPLPLPPFPTTEETREDPAQASRTVIAINRMLKEIPSASRVLIGRQPPLAAPVGPAEQPWLPYASAKNEAYATQYLGQPETSPRLAKLVAIFDASQREDVAAFNAAVAEYKRDLAGDPPAGLEMETVEFEAYFNRFSPFYTAIPLYAIALVMTLLAWLAAVAFPRFFQLMRSATFWLILLTFALHTFALAARVVISGRPPVTNLYSSAVFVGWGCVALGLVIEYIYRIGFGNLVSSIAGIGALIIAHFLAADGDTIQVLQAVLDTQFWLTVHVLTVTLGYSATFLAGLLGVAAVAFVWGKRIVFTANRLVTPPEGRRLPADWVSPAGRSETERMLSTMIYGTVCFAAVFSLTGTVLGGLWADDSWGRFWGWDPKENGALIVVLWNALVLHARSARLVRDRGLALLVVGGNLVTAWSWFGVNELGVGLHSYGFTEGAAQMLWLFWFSQLTIIGIGLLPSLWSRFRSVPRPTA